MIKEQWGLTKWKNFVITKLCSQDANPRVGVGKLSDSSLPLEVGFKP